MTRPTLAIALLASALAMTTAHADGPVAIGTLHCPAGLDAVKGKPVTVVGVVTGQYSTARASHFTVQDATGGVTIYGEPKHCAAIGDSVKVTGTVTVYNGLVEISGKTDAPLDIQTLGKTRVPKPVTVTPAALANSADAGGCEPNESRRVMLAHVLVRMADGAMPPAGATFKDDTNYRVMSAGADSTTDVAVVRVVDAEGCDPSHGLDGVAIPTGPVDVIGTVSQYLRREATSGGYQLLLGLREELTATK